LEAKRAEEAERQAGSGRASKKAIVNNFFEKHHFCNKKPLKMTFCNKNFNIFLTEKAFFDYFFYTFFAGITIV
jgi:hypothetical protein